MQRGGTPRTLNPFLLSDRSMLAPSDIIVAIASPPGRSVRGIVRMSGPRAFELAASMLQPADQAPGKTFSRGVHRRRFVLVPRTGAMIEKSCSVLVLAFP